MSTNNKPLVPLKSVEDIDRLFDGRSMLEIDEYLKKHPEVRSQMHEIYLAQEDRKVQNKYRQQLEQQVKQRLSPENLRKLGAHYWWFLGEMPVTFPNAIDLIEQSGESFDKCILKVYDTAPSKYENLFDYLTCNHLLTKRKHIIQEAVNCFKQGYYQASVCLVLPQFEGFLCDLVQEYNLIQDNLKRYKGRVPRLLAKLQKLLDQKLKESPYAELYNVKVLGSVVFPADNASATPLRRNSILHGEALNFGTKANALRALVALETLARIVQEHFEVKNPNNPEGALETGNFKEKP